MGSRKSTDWVWRRRLRCSPGAFVSSTSAIRPVCCGTSRNTPGQWRDNDSAMYLLLTTFCVMVLIRWAGARYLRPNSRSGFMESVRSELLGWLIIVGVLLAAFLLVFFCTSLFGPIRPVHEWGN